MKSKILDIIKSAIDGDAKVVKNLINSAIASRTIDGLRNKKTEIAQSMFGLKKKLSEDKSTPVGAGEAPIRKIVTSTLEEENSLEQHFNKTLEAGIKHIHPVVFTLETGKKVTVKTDKAKEIHSKLKEIEAGKRTKLVQGAVKDERGWYNMLKDLGVK